jgi:hypothetical protein
LARAYVAANATYSKKLVTITKTMSTRTQSISKLQKGLASTSVVAEKEKMQKEITQLTTENTRDTEMLAD